MYSTNEYMINSLETEKDCIIYRVKTIKDNTRFIRMVLLQSELIKTNSIHSIRIVKEYDEYIENVYYNIRDVVSANSNFYFDIFEKERQIIITDKEQSLIRLTMTQESKRCYVIITLNKSMV